nr:MAG TPA: hypothetical protein [Caudoviricetes sp.]
MINVIVILLILVSTMVGVHFCNTVFELIVVFVLGVLSSLVYTLLCDLIRLEDKVRQEGILSYEDRLLKQETALKLQRERLDWERAEREREAKIRQKELEIFK